MPEGVVDKNMGATRSRRLSVKRRRAIPVKSPVSNARGRFRPVVLAQSYYRISQPETIDSLGKQCFNDKKLKMLKKLALKSDQSVASCAS